MTEPCDDAVATYMSGVTVSAEPVPAKPIQGAITHVLAKSSRMQILDLVAVAHGVGSKDARDDLCTLIKAKHPDYAACMKCGLPCVDEPRWGWIHAGEPAIDHSCYAPKNTLHDFTAADPNSSDCDICGEGRVYYAHGGAVCSISYCEANGTEYVGANPWPFCPEHAEER